MPITNCNSSQSVVIGTNSDVILDAIVSKKPKLDPAEMQRKGKIPASGIFHKTQSRLNSIISKEEEIIMLELADNLKALWEGESKMKGSKDWNDFLTEAYAKLNQTDADKPIDSPALSPEVIVKIKNEWEKNAIHGIKLAFRYKELSARTQKELIDMIIDLESRYESGINKEK